MNSGINSTETRGIVGFTDNDRIDLTRLRRVKDLVHFANAEHESRRGCKVLSNELNCTGHFTGGDGED